MRKIYISGEVKNSIILSFYMMLIFLYYMISPLRPLIFILFILYLFAVNKCRKRTIIFSSIFFLFSLIVQIINFSLHHFLFFIFLGPCFAYWVYKSRFEINILRRTFLFVQFLLFLLYLKGRTFIGVLAGLSENYISVLMIGNIVLIACIEFRQKEEISILPSLFGFVLSLLTLGRSGIACTFVLLSLLCYMRFLSFSKNKRIIIALLILSISVSFGIRYYDLIVDFFNNFELFNKFQERGLKSPSRGILIDEYFSHINLETFILGYKFENNPWFIHYGLNPHNSFIRLHYQIGVFAIILFVYVLMKIFKLLKRKQFVLMTFLLVMIMRAYTDVYLFFGFYDFLLYYIIFIGGDTIKQESNSIRPYIRFSN